MGTLYLIATPIGNMEDITLRALRLLREVPLIAAEDTRTARVLLNHHGIRAKLTSYNEHNHRAKTPALLFALDAGDVALVTDAGTPGISDPGEALVQAAVGAGHTVVPVPGASALAAAVAASGMPARRFHFVAFLPRTSGARKRALAEAAAPGDALVLYESPQRVAETLRDALDVLGDRQVAICRELTKKFEEIWRGPISGAVERFADSRGEFTLVIEGGAPVSNAATASQKIDEAIAELRVQQASAKDALARLTSLGLSRREAYRRWHDG